MINEERGNTENGAGRKEECRYWAENLNAMIKQLLIQEILGYVGTKGPEAGEKTECLTRIDIINGTNEHSCLAMLWTV